MYQYLFMTNIEEIKWS